MAKIMRTDEPILLIVSGSPAAGKTTLATWLSQELMMPLISKDNVREVLFNGLGYKDRPWAQLLGRASIDLMYFFAEKQLEVGHSVILDNAFDPELSAPRFQILLERYRAKSIQIICTADQEILLQRFQERAVSGQRHPGHGDEKILDELRVYLAKERPHGMDLGGLLIEVDTTDWNKVNYHHILDQVHSH